MKCYVVLLASILIQICLGGIYAWSEFVPILKSKYNLSTAQTQLIFGITIITFTLVMIPAGRLLKSKGPRLIASIGAVLFASGYLLSAFSSGNFYLLVLGIGVIGGSGIGFGYVCPLATCMKWFPDKKGLITGIAVAGFGGGAVLLTRFVEILLSHKMTLLDIFFWLGISYGIVLIICSLLLTDPTQRQNKQASQTTSLMTVCQNKIFWKLVLGMFSGTFAGLMVVGNLKPLAISFGLTPKMAGIAISFFALGNACGRIVWGNFYDKLKCASIPISLCFISLSLLCLLFVGQNSVFFLPISLAIGIGFGSCFVIYAASVSDFFGTAAVGTIYPLIFFSYGISGIAGPVTGGAFFDLTGYYSTAIIVAASVTFCATVANRSFLQIVSKKIKEKIAYE